jgi:FtsZ-binding cell division protein ZapB
MPEDNTPMVEDQNAPTGMPEPMDIPDPGQPANVEFATENAVVKPKRKQQRVVKTPAKPNRLPEDCYMLDPKKMTDKEKNDVILFFQNAVEEIQNKYRILDQNTQGAFMQARILQDENERLKREMSTKINLLKQNISIMYQNSLLINPEVENHGN